MVSPLLSCVVRLVSQADKIALIAGGKVEEFGSHDELMEKPHGRYKRLFESSRRDTQVNSAVIRKTMALDQKQGDKIFLGPQYFLTIPICSPTDSLFSLVASFQKSHLLSNQIYSPILVPHSLLFC